MELTYEQAKQMIEQRIQKHSEIATIVSAPTFGTRLSEIVAFHGVDTALAPLIEHELLVVLALYAPITELPSNITESTGIPLETSASIATMVHNLLLEPIYEDLLAYDVVWHTELERRESMPVADPTLKERLDLRPSDVDTPRTGTAPGSTTEEEMAQPLTREELFSALSAKRTMAGDIAAATTRPESTATVHGYEAYRNQAND